MAFLTINRHHGIKCSSIGKAKFSGVFDGFTQLLMTINQQVTRNIWRLCCEVKRNTISFSIPIGDTAIFFSGKTFRTNIESLIFAGIGLVELKYIIAYSLLRSNITTDFNVTFCPDRLPSCCLFLL